MWWRVRRLAELALVWNRRELKSEDINIALVLNIFWNTNFSIVPRKTKFRTSITWESSKSRFGIGQFMD